MCLKMEILHIYVCALIIWLYIFIHYIARYLKSDTNAVTVLGPSNSVTGNSPQWTVKRQD